jgi:hypothetical protein
VVAAVLSSADVTATRRAVEGLHLGTQRRIHFKDESDGRKRSILDVVTAAPVKVRLYECPRVRHELTAREACLTALVEDLAALGGERLVIERDDSTISHDRRTLYQAVGKVGVRGDLQYVHLRAKDEALLALPDAFAWCHAKGGKWRRRIEDLVDDHVRL